MLTKRLLCRGVKHLNNAFAYEYNSGEEPRPHPCRDKCRETLEPKTGSVQATHWITLGNDCARADCVGCLKYRCSVSLLNKTLLLPLRGSNAKLEGERWFVLLRERWFVLCPMERYGNPLPAKGERRWVAFSGWLMFITMSARD